MSQARTAHIKPPSALVTVADATMTPLQAAERPPIGSLVYRVGYNVHVVPYARDEDSTRVTFDEDALSLALTPDLKEPCAQTSDSRSSLAYTDTLNPARSKARQLTTRSNELCKYLRDRYASAGRKEHPDAIQTSSGLKSKP